MASLVSRFEPGTAARMRHAPGLVDAAGYRASGSGRSWNFTTFGRVPLPVSVWNGVRVP